MRNAAMQHGVQGSCVSMSPSRHYRSYSRCHDSTASVDCKFAAPVVERNTEQLRGEVAEVIELVSARASRCRPVRGFAGVNGGRFASLQARIDACRCLFERKNDEPPKFS